MKEGNVAKAQKSFAAFRANWPGIRDFVKMRSAEAYDTVEKGIADLDAALKRRSHRPIRSPGSSTA